MMNPYPYPWNPYNVQNPSMNSMQTQQRVEIVRVNGENGARTFQLAPNSSVLLLDENSPIVWVVQTDGAGYKTVTPYSITPYQPEPPVDVKSLESRIKRLEDALNAKPDTGNVKRTKDQS